LSDLRLATSHFCLVLLTLFVFLRSETGGAAEPDRTQGLQLRILQPVDGQIMTSAVVRIRVAIRGAVAPSAVRFRVFVDGELSAERGVAIVAGEATARVEAGEEAREFDLDMPPRDCALRVVAESRTGQQTESKIRLRWGGEQFFALPNLYVLAIGVSRYQRPDLRLEYAAKDASDVAAAFARQKGQLFGQVKTSVLLDSEASFLNVQQRLEWLRRQATRRDVAVLFLAGHGINEPSTGEYYFLTYDADPENVNTTMISQRTLQDTLRHTAGKVLLLLDSCHSGNVFPEWRTRGASDPQQWARELSGTESGVTVFAASTGRQASKESAAWNNGAFSKALVEGLRGRAAFYSGRPVTVNMLEVYVSERVKQLTHGSQTPTVAKPANIPDFPIAMPHAETTPEAQADSSIPEDPAPATAPSSRTPLYKKWWLWTAVGSAALIGLIAVASAVGVAEADRKRFGDVAIIVDLRPK